jgi:hypothetical protein
MATFASIILGLIIGCYIHAWSIFGVDVVTALGKNAKFQTVISDFQKKPGITDQTKTILVVTAAAAWNESLQSLVAFFEIWAFIFFATRLDIRMVVFGFLIFKIYLLL